MKSLHLLIVVTILSLASPGFPQDAAAKERDKLQGTWQFLRQEYDGTDENSGESKLVIAGDKMALKDKQGAKSITWKIDPAKQPKTIDLTMDVNGKALQLTGIYQLDGDTLKICASEAGQARPTEFASPKGSRLTLFVLKRLKS